MSFVISVHHWAYTTKNNPHRHIPQDSCHSHRKIGSRWPNDLVLNNDNIPAAQWEGWRVAFTAAAPLPWSDKRVNELPPLFSRGDVRITNTFRFGLAVWFWTSVLRRNQRPLMSKPMVHCLYGGAAAGCLMAWTAGLPGAKKLLIRGIFSTCRSTWSRLLLSSGTRELGCLWQRLFCFQERQWFPFLHVVQDLQESSGGSRPVTMLSLWRWQREFCLFGSLCLQLPRAARLQLLTTSTRSRLCPRLVFGRKSLTFILLRASYSHFIVFLVAGWREQNIILRILFDSYNDSKFVY